MLSSSVAAILARDLRTLRREVEAYPDEEQIWQTAPGITNPAGNLVLHLTGNVQHYVGKHLGASGYVRDRPAEFARRKVPRAELFTEIAKAEAALAALSRLEEKALQKDFPEIVGDSHVQTGDFLVHLACHFTYHLGQIDYHRRLVTGRNEPVIALRPSELSSARPVTTTTRR
ncbi:MAG: DUF1572 family protein [Gemmatimonadetes bacterium]|nr:DUF1572 family protein [Gemmatimonadota bacterium]